MNATVASSFEHPVNRPAAAARAAVSAAFAEWRIA
jgi:hypothetical protein